VGHCDCFCSNYPRNNRQSLNVILGFFVQPNQRVLHIFLVVLLIWLWAHNGRESCWDRIFITSWPSHLTSFNLESRVFRSKIYTLITFLLSCNCVHSQSNNPKSALTHHLPYRVPRSRHLAALLKASRSNPLLFSRKEGRIWNASACRCDYAKVRRGSLKLGSYGPPENPRLLPSTRPFSCENIRDCTNSLD